MARAPRLTPGRLAEVVPGSSTASIYAGLPVFLQNAACSYYGWKEGRVRFGHPFEERLRELTESEWWPSDRITDYQDYQLQALVRHAYDHVPFYRSAMGDRGLTPQDIRGRPDLTKLPLLTKETVRDLGQGLVSDIAASRQLIARHTSGTTGKSLQFYSSRSAIAFQWAVWWRHRRRFGLNPGDLHVNFTGQPVVPPEQSDPPFWRWNRPFRQALLTMHHLTPKAVRPIIDFLNSRQFAFWSGYPSIIHALVLSATDAGLSLDSAPRVVTTGAENVLDTQRRDIAAFTHAVLTDTYGFSEGCGNASPCPHSRYHEDFEFGILECVNGERIDKDRTRGSIVCTGFANLDMPFIRYLTGDVGVWDTSGGRCACGRDSPVLLSIEGRMDDYVLTPEGRRIMRFDYLFKHTSNVKEAQVVQREPGTVTLRIVRRPGYGSGDEELITELVHCWISPRLEVVYEYVDEIERDRNGKFRAVRSLLSPGLGSMS